MATERVSIIIVMWQNLSSRHHGESKEEGKKKAGTKTFSITIRGNRKKKNQMVGGFDGDRKGLNRHSHMAT